MPHGMRRVRAAGWDADEQTVLVHGGHLADALRQAQELGRTMHAGLTDVHAQLSTAAATLDDLVGYSVVALTVVLS